MFREGFDSVEALDKARQEAMVAHDEFVDTAARYPASQTV